MNTFFRNSLMLVLVLGLFASLGCSTKTTDPIDDEAELAMTAEESQAAASIADGIIYFPYDSFGLSSEAKSTLSSKADIMKRFPQLRVTVEGHCDERGTEEYNLALGERRARAAYEYLLNLGVNASQMEMVSFGKLHPAISGGGESAWSKNRRDEFKAYKPKY